MVKLLLILVLGFALNKLHILDGEMNRKLSHLIVTVTTPMLIIASVCGMDASVSRLSILPVLLGGFVLYGALILFGELVARLPIFKKENRGENACMMVFSNNGFMGIPVLTSIYGTDAVFYNSIINFPFNLFIYTYALLRLSGGKGEKKINLKAILSPGFILGLVALLIFLTGLPLPQVLVDTCDMVGSITSPLSMIVLGSTIAMYPLKESLRDARCYLFAVVRLFVIPLLVLAVCRMIGIDDYLTGITVLSTAMPVASMVLMMCGQCDGNTEVVSRNILVTTVLSVITIPIIASILTL
jgi:hypothetical protein